MKKLASALVSVLLSGCTNSTPGSDKTAAAVTYDNASSHLLSTTVQDAIDDLAAAAPRCRIASTASPPRVR